MITSPITRPITSRIASAIAGARVGGANPLVWHAAYPDSDGVMQAQLIGSGTPTFNVDAGLLLPDHEGIYRTTAEDTAPWHGARKVTNLLRYSEDLSNAAWTPGTVTYDAVEGAYKVTKGGGVWSDINQYPVGNSLGVAGDVTTFSVEIKSATGSAGTCRLYNSSADFTSGIPVPTEWTRVSNTETLTAAGATSIRNSTVDFYIRKAQLEVVTGQANQNPSEYVPTDIAKAGAPELVTNGGFDTDTTGWTKTSDTSFAVSGGKLRFTRGANVNQYFYNTTPISVVSGRKYVVSVDYLGDSANSTEYGDLRIGTSIGGLEHGRIDTLDTPKTYSTVITAVGTSLYLNLYLRNGSSGDWIEVDNISVVEATPGYAYYGTENGNTVDGSNVVTEAQGATLDPLPSLYGAPAYTNSLTYSNDLTNAAWAQVGTSVSALDAVGLTGAPNTATTLTDDDGAVYEKITRSVTIPNDSNINVLRIFLAEDAITSRFPEIRLTLQGGTSQSNYIQINTNTGALNQRIAVGTTGYEANNIGGWWELLISVANNGTGNTVAAIEAIPAISTTLGGASTAATGSIIVGNAELHLNKTIAQVRGSAPIITAASTVTTTAISMSYDIANHSDTQGGYFLEMTPQWASTESVTGWAALNTRNASYSLIGNVSGGSAEAVTGRDSTINTSINGSFSSGDTRKIGLAYDSAAANMAMGLNGSFDTVKAYDGSFNFGSDAGYIVVLSGVYASAPALIRNIRRYNLNYTAAKAKITELMS